MTIGEFIRERRKAAGLTQKELYDRSTLLSHAHVSAVSKIENSDRPLSFTEASELSRLLDFSLLSLQRLVPEGQYVCQQCKDHPPRGYTCNECGKAAS